MKVPTDRVRPPSEGDLFLGGRTDTGVPATPQIYATPPGDPAPPGPGGMASNGPAPPRGVALLDIAKLEKDYGHVF